MIAGLKKATPLLIIVCAMLTLQNWWRIELLLHPIDTDSLADQDVVIYSTNWCPYCAKTRTFLRQANIAFVEYDIEKSPQAYAEYEQLSGRGVPVIKVGNTVIQGYDPALIRRAIDELTEQHRNKPHPR